MTLFYERILRLDLVLACNAASSAALGQCTTAVAGGTISGQRWTLARSPYCVEGDLLINNLTIDPGVTVAFTGNFKLEVAGILTAVGTSTSPIVFTTSAENQRGWQCLFFNQSLPGSQFAHFVVEKATGSGIEINRREMTLRDCVIRNNSRPGGIVGGAGISSEMGICLTQVTPTHSMRGW